MKSQRQRHLFSATDMPDGFTHIPDAISSDEEKAHVARFTALPFTPFAFHGYVGNRRVVSFGWHYDYSERHIRESEPIPDFLNALRMRAGELAKAPAENFQQVLVTEYAPGAGIGWHRDKREFGEVVAFSFLAPCILRFRRKTVEAWERRSLEIEGRAAYVLRGDARHIWEHSIPPLAALRYSVTFRTVTFRTLI